MLLVRAVYLLAVGAVLREVSGYDLCNSLTKLIFGQKYAHRIRIEDAPYMAALQYIYPGGVPSFLCGATIIHERFLLTAAHCYEHPSAKFSTFASMGSKRYQNTRKNTIIKIEKALCHEEYDNISLKNDICLLKLKKPVPFGKKIAKIQLADKNFEVDAGTAVNVTGWGNIEGFYSPLDLLTTTIPVVSHKCCHRKDNRIDDTMICAGVKGRGPCYGDSGGPLLFNNVQIGVVSRAVDVDHPECGSGMDMFTRVNRFLHWIHRTIANNL